MIHAAILVLGAGVLQAIDWICHRSDLTRLSVPAGADAVKHYRRQFRSLRPGKWDNIVGVLPFVWTYMLCVAAVIAYHDTSWIVIKLGLVLFVAGRFRTLQEIGHFAIHGSLCHSKKWGMLLANILYQFPAFMPEIVARRQIHVVRHHASVNQPDDPDLKELLDKGIRPGMTKFEFWRGVFYPLTPRGLRDRILECSSYFFDKTQNRHRILRILCVGAIVAAFVWSRAYEELLALYVFPVLIVYPLYYWIAHMALHRWFAGCEAVGPYHERELELGRPTEFSGLVGIIVRNNIFPLGDSYHLAHSLFPAVRWNYLHQVDRLMKDASPSYRQNSSRNLFIASDGYPSALSELRDRLVKGSCHAGAIADERART